VLLDSVGRRSGDEWFDVAGRRVEVSVSVYDSVAAMVEELDRQGFDSAAAARLRLAGDVLSGVWVEVRISGRGDFHAEMLELTERILAAGGYGVDDYSGGVWSLSEIRDGRADCARFRA
jgi:hypothetical protein